jgi:hypothetical protein
MNINIEGTGRRMIYVIHMVVDPVSARMNDSIHTMSLCGSRHRWTAGSRRRNSEEMKASYTAGF